MGPVRYSPLMTLVAVSLLGAGDAVAGGSSGGGGGCGCVPTTHQVKVPGVSITPPSVSIGIPAVGVGYGSGGGSASGAGSASGSGSAEAGVSTSLSVNVSGSGSSSGLTNGALLNNFSGGGGGGGWAPEGGVVSDIPELKVEGPAPTLSQRICAAYKAEIRQVAIQAVCLDDRDVPHPASQLSPERAVAPGYDGEIFRCIAGARMQYTIADFSGQADFNHGQTVVCRKGEALYHSANGATQCRAQIPQRDCNERSLLRRFGAGIKVLAMAAGQTCVAWRTETAAASAAQGESAGIVLRP